MPTPRSSGGYIRSSSTTPSSPSSSSYRSYNNNVDDDIGAEMSTRTEHLQKTTMEWKKSTAATSPSRSAATSPSSSSKTKTKNNKTMSVGATTTERKILSEDEVSTLVQNALMRARQATSSFSPRNSPSRYGNGSSSKPTSPSSVLSYTSNSNSNPPTPKSSGRAVGASGNGSSATTSGNNPYVPRDEDMNNNVLPSSLPPSSPQSYTSSTSHMAMTRRSKRSTTSSPSTNNVVPPSPSSSSYRNRTKGNLSINTTPTATSSSTSARTRYISGSRSRVIEGSSASTSASSRRGYDSSPRTPQTPQTPYSLASSIDDYATPDTSEVGAYSPSSDMMLMVVGNNSSSMASVSTADIFDGTTVPGVASVNSSDAIIRKVEEEIANARKAAQEANRRLAGVSANLSPTKSKEEVNNNDDDNQNDDVAAEEQQQQQRRRRQNSLSRQRQQHHNQADQHRSSFGQILTDAVHLSESDEQNLYDSAMDVIGEEFDMMDDTIGRNNLSSQRVSNVLREMSDNHHQEEQQQQQDEEVIDVTDVVDYDDDHHGHDHNSNNSYNDSVVSSAETQSISPQMDKIHNGDGNHGFPPPNQSHAESVNSLTVDCTNVPSNEGEKIVMSPSEEIDSILQADSSGVEDDAGGNNEHYVEEPTMDKAVLDAESPIRTTQDEDRDLGPSPSSSSPVHENLMERDTKHLQVNGSTDLPDDEAGDIKFDNHQKHESQSSETNDCLPNDPDDEVSDMRVSGEKPFDEEPSTEATAKPMTNSHKEAKTSIGNNTEIQHDDNNDIQTSDSQVFIYQVRSAGSTDAVATARVPLPKDSSDGTESPSSPSSCQKEENVDVEEAIEIVTEKMSRDLVSDGKESIVRMDSSDINEVNGSTSDDDNDIFHEARGSLLDESCDRVNGGNANTEDNVKIDASENADDGPDSASDEVKGLMVEEESERKTIDVDGARDENMPPPTSENDTSRSLDTPEADEVVEKASSGTVPEEKDTIASSIMAPSPRRVALVEKRRSEESTVTNVRNVICGEDETATTGDRGKTLVNRARKVKFKQRYPVPPQIKKPRQPSEIVADHRTKAPKESLYQAKPKKDLCELLEAVTGSSVARRSNACGALKVLSTQKKNRLTLVRTEGFLDAMIFAMQDEFSKQDAESGKAARTRAVNVVLNVAEVKENRFHVLNHPGMMDALMKCIIQDNGEGRALGCATMATLAKSTYCREPLAETENLIEVLAVVLKGDEPSMYNKKDKRQTKQTERNVEEEKKEYSEDEKDEIVSAGSYSTSSSTGDNQKVMDDEARRKKSEFKKRARMNACAAMLHLSKECSISQRLCSSGPLKYCLVSSSRETEELIHTKCLEIICNLSRFPHNNKTLVEYPGLVETLLINGQREDDTDRLWSMRTFQNLSSDATAKSILAQAKVLELLSMNMMRQKYEEQLASTAALYNISTEPGAVVPLTNTRNVVATLVHVAHSPTSETKVRTIACDALATLGLWLQTLSGAGTVPEDITPVPLPSYITTGWKRWEA